MYKKKGDRLLLRIATQEHGNTVKTQEDTNKMDDKGLKLFASSLKSKRINSYIFDRSKKIS